jgi:predicted RecA/RadA family phage recombinase
MRNHVQKGENITIPSPAAVASGDLVVVGALYGVAAGDADTGGDLDVVTVGVFDLPKVSALAINLGDKVYFDSSSKLVSKTASGNTYIGVAVTAAVNPSATVNVRLNGAF